MAYYNCFSTLEIKLRLEIGLSLFRFSLDKVDFLRCGLTCACLKSSGNKPEHSDTFTVFVTVQILKIHHLVMCAVLRIGKFPLVGCRAL